MLYYPNTIHDGDLIGQHGVSRHAKSVAVIAFHLRRGDGVVFRGPPVQWTTFWVKRELGHSAMHRCVPAGWPTPVGGLWREVQV